MDAFEIVAGTFLRGQYLALRIESAACHQKTGIAFRVTGNVMGGEDPAGDRRAAHVVPFQCISVRDNINFPLFVIGCTAIRNDVVDPVDHAGQLLGVRSR